VLYTAITMLMSAAGEKSPSTAAAEA
jgi:hypothetical protein